MQTAGRTYRISLGWRILLFSSAVLIVLIVAMLAYVDFQAHRFVTNRISADLLQGRTRVEAMINDQFSDLELTARLISSIPKLEALLSNTDAPTIRDFLKEYQEQNHRPDLLIALDPNGHVLGRTDSAGSDSIADVQTRWIKPAMETIEVRGGLATTHGLYNAVLVPCEAGGTVFGFILAGSRIDDKLARNLSDISHSEVAILSDGVVGSTLRQTRLPWHSAAQWTAQMGDREEPRQVWLGGEAYSALSASLKYPNAPVVIGLQSDDQALAPYRRIQAGLLVLGLLATAAGVAGSAMLAQHLTAPISALVQGTREVAAGNFDFELKVSRGDEIGDLAESFNHMTRGLRERADMQKFVSQSTLEMIQSSQPASAAGERKVLTIFFSDIRGFTSMSEHRDPEQVVNILNQVFTIQAELVKRFSGDIDKYVGDAIVALFQGEKAPLNAIRCAAEIHKAIRAYNARLPINEPDIRLGIGITTGEVILGSIGSEDRRDFTAIGSHVNLCARLCALAGPGETLLGELTYRAVGDLVDVERLQPQHVKGFTDAVAVYRMQVPEFTV